MSRLKIDAPSYGRSITQSARARARAVMGRHVRALVVALPLTMAAGASQASAQSVPLCQNTANTASGSLNLNHQEVFLAAASSTSAVNVRTFALRPTDTSSAISARLNITDGNVTLFKGAGSVGDVEVGVRLKVSVDGREQCNVYRKLARQEVPLPVPGHFHEQVRAETLVLTCNRPVPAGSRSVRVEVFGESKINIGGVIIGGDIEGRASLRGNLTLVANNACSPLVDADGDGANNLNDCNDLDASRFPGNPELCDGRDNDCDGGVDEGVLNTFFPDRDGDSFGGSPAVTACARPTGFVTRGGDCNDANNAVNPARSELCGDGLDNNCNGVADDRGSEISGFRDADGDSFGDPTEPTFVCGLPPGYVVNDSDCDDSNPALGACNTPVSTNPDAISCIAPSGSRARLTCEEVTVAGETSCAGTSCDLDEPADFSLSFTGECFAFETSATCEGDPAEAIVCIEYDPDALMASGPCGSNPEACLRMFHCPEGSAPCPSPTAPPLSPAPGTDAALNIYCAYVDEVPSAEAFRTVAFSYSKSTKSAPRASKKDDLFFLGVDERDPDFDGIPTGMDNCPEGYNPSQRDSDGDGIGDKCDPVMNNSVKATGKTKTNDTTK